MFDAIASVLAFFYSLPVVGGSVGVAIILLTAAVMILLMPLTIRATKSTIKMQEVQPKLKELQKKHKDDKQTLNTELMALYQANGINPVGGCLPMVAQLPVFLVLFNVLRGLSRRVSETPFFAIADHARVTNGGAGIDGETFDPKYLSHTSEMYDNLSEQTRMAFGPFDLAQEALDVIRDNFLHGIPYVILILFVVATSYYQQRQVSSRRSGSAGMNPQQEMILKFLPLLSGVWSFAFPAGLVVYWATSNTFRIGQQAYITRAFYGEREAQAEAEAEAEAEALAKGKKEKEKEKGPTDGSANGSGRAKSSTAKPAISASGSNGTAKDDSDEPASVGATSKDDRAEAWDRRRRDRARARDVSKNRSGESSRVTPKGTKPSGSKKKRKR